MSRILRTMEDVDNATPAEVSATLIALNGENRRMDEITANLEYYRESVRYVLSDMGVKPMPEWKITLRNLWTYEAERCGTLAKHCQIFGRHSTADAYRDSFRRMNPPASLGLTRADMMAAYMTGWRSLRSHQLQSA